MSIYVYHAIFWIVSISSVLQNYYDFPNNLKWVDDYFPNNLLLFPNNLSYINYFHVWKNMMVNE